MEQRYLELQSNLNDQEQKPVVAVWGLMNAGKSYLLNMLTDHFGEEYFKTNDFRETAEIKKYESNQIIYLDTPGLDANEADNLEAIRGVARADVVLFVHQPQGELEQIELNFLHSLKNSFGEYAEKNIVLIISKTDKEDEEKIQQIEMRMLEQCEKLLNFKPVIFQISNTRFHKGMNEHKAGLTQASHIFELSAFIQKIAAHSQGINRQRTQLELNNLSDEVAELVEQLCNKKEQRIRQLKKEFNEFNHVADDLRKYITDSRKRYSSL